MIESWHPPVHEAPMQLQIDHAAIMISSTGKMSEERRTVGKVLQQNGFPVIDYKTAFAQSVTPLEWVVESARQSRAVFLLMGQDYGSDMPFEGLGATELEFESALGAGVPIYAFLRSDAPTPGQHLPGANLDQAQFVERVRAYLPNERIFFFQEEMQEEELAQQVHEALNRLEGLRPGKTRPAIADSMRQRWYRRRVQRWMGMLPHLTRKEGMPLEQVYVTLQTLPEEHFRQKDEEQGEVAIFKQDRGERAEEEEKKKVKTLNIDDTLKQFPRLVLQGNPGCGKSVALRWYALTAAEHITPIFISLAVYARAVESRQVSSLEAFIRRQEQHFLQTPLEDTSLWLAHVHGGQALLLLDALDEVPQRDYRLPDGIIRPLQEKVLADILEFAKVVPPASRIVLTTRATGFDPRRVEGVFTVTQVQPLTPPQQRQLVRYWLRMAHPNDPETITETATRIIEALQRQANLNSWARTPLMLTLLTALADAIGADFLAQTLTKAAVFRQAIRLMLGQWSALNERQKGGYLWSKEILLLSLAWQNLEGGRREAITREDVLQAWETLPTDVQQNLTADTMLAELSAVDGFLTPISEQTYTFYHPTFQEYLGASRIVSLPESERRKLLERHRLNEQWEEITQMLVSELDRSGRSTDADAVVETLIDADAQPVHPFSWKDPFHLALARAARCQGIRTDIPAQRPVGERVAKKWGHILQQTLPHFYQYRHIRELACQGILDMGAATGYAYPDLREMFAKWEARNHAPYLIPTTAIETLGNLRHAEAKEKLEAGQKLRDLLGPGKGLGKEQAAALKALIRLGPEAARPAREVLARFVYIQSSMGADSTHVIGELAATLILQLSPTIEELKAIARLGPIWEQETLWATLSLDPAVAVPFLREWINNNSLISLSLYGNRLDFTGDTYIDSRAEALEVARCMGPAAEPLLENILYRAISDVPRNRRVAEEVFLSFGAHTIPVLKKMFFTYNEYARETFFQHILDSLESLTDADEIENYLKEGIKQIRHVEEIIVERDAPSRTQERVEEERREQEWRDNLHLQLRNRPLFLDVRVIERYGTGAVEFLEDLCTLTEDENASVDARIMALHQIEKLGPQAGKACTTLCKLVLNPQYSVYAFEALVAMKSAAADALPLMRQFLRDEDLVQDDYLGQHKRVHAIEVIGWLGSAAERALPDLIVVVRDRKNRAWGQDMVRKAAIEALGRLWPLTRPYLDDLRDALLHDPSGAVREAAAKVLGQIGVSDPHVVEALHASLIASSVSTQDLLHNV